MDRLIIIGSGHLSQHIAYYAEEDNKYSVIGYLDDFKEVGEKAGRHNIIGKISDIVFLYEKKMFDIAIIGIGYNHFPLRKKIFEDLKSKIAFGRLIHSNAYVAASCVIGDGVVILPGCVLDNNVIIENNVFINAGVTIAHDSTIGAHSFLSPAVAIAGFVSVGECCNIGINATIIDNISVVDSTQIGGGGVVIKNIDVPGIYAGVPVKFIKK